MTYDGPGGDEDFGLAQVTRNAADRFAFRTSPIRNVALQPTFGHNGAYTRLEDVVRHHIDPVRWATKYTPAAAGVAADLRGPMPPIAPVLERLDARMRVPLSLTEPEVAQLVDFVKNGLLDAAAAPARLRALIPATLPSGKKIHTFQ